MLAGFANLDRRMVHEKYHMVVRRFEMERDLPGAKAKVDRVKHL